jgi:hypothetical protein
MNNERFTALSNFDKNGALPLKWEKEIAHEYIVKHIYAMEAIKWELMTDDPARFGAAWLDIMALSAGRDLTPKRQELRDFVKKKNAEWDKNRRERNKSSLEIIIEEELKNSRSSKSWRELERL